MNSPEEKARDILDKIEGVLGYSIPTHDDPYFRQTIEIGLIFVDEIMNALENAQRETESLIYSETEWLEVKEVIKKM